MIYVVKPPTEPIRTTIHLPASKSISNRVLMIRALSGCDFNISNLSDCDDTYVMEEGLKKLPKTIDVGAAGTSMRFLTAYLAQLDGQEHVITGSKRMKERPIKVLVQALRELGADIEYLEEVGFPPLCIRGKKLRCKQSITLDGSVSSQYISAMLLIAPMLETGLKLKLSGDIASRPYIDMTIALMNHFGAHVSWRENTPVIVVDPVPYRYDRPEFTVESDWSAAAFWLEIMALREMAKKEEVSLPGLVDNSLQGDKAARDLFWDLGCYFNSLEQKAYPSCVSAIRGSHIIDFTHFPDLAQAAIVTACLADVPFLYSGLESLHIKETDRVKALKTELAKLGYSLRGGEEKDEEGLLMWQRGRVRKESKPVIATYKDHRMAMAFAPACLVTGEIRISDPLVVSKSYPRFWDDLRNAGFTIEEEME